MKNKNINENNFSSEVVLSNKNNSIDVTRLTPQEIEVYVGELFVIDDEDSNNTKSNTWADRVQNKLKAIQDEAMSNTKSAVSTVNETTKTVKNKFITATNDLGKSIKDTAQKSNTSLKNKLNSFSNKTLDSFDSARTAVADRTKATSDFVTTKASTTSTVILKASKSTFFFVAGDTPEKRSVRGKALVAGGVGFAGAMLALYFQDSLSKSAVARAVAAGGIDSLANSQNNKPQFSGVYIYTYPEYLQKASYNDRPTLYKIGASKVGTFGRVMSQGRATEVPEDLVLIKEVPSNDPFNLEKYIHNTLKSQGAHKKTTRGGTEWFETTQKNINKIIKSYPNI